MFQQYIYIGFYHPSYIFYFSIIIITHTELIIYIRMHIYVGSGGCIIC